MAPITNCHVHIFTAEHVPAHLSRTILPWPLYKWVNIHGLVRFMKWMKRQGDKVYAPPWRDRLVAHGRFVNDLHRSKVWYLITSLRWWVVLLGCYYTYRLFIPPPSSHLEHSPIERVISLLERYHVLFPVSSTWLKAWVVLGILIAIPASRRFIWPVLVAFQAFLGKIPSKQIKELWDRYKLIVNYSLYGVSSKSKKKRSGQGYLLRALKAQYPTGTNFIILPMDMEFMGAGPVASLGGYHRQMRELQALKASPTFGPVIKPFIHVDPRRVSAQIDPTSPHYMPKPFFDWKVRVDGKMELEDCSVRDWIRAGFCGFKIYPALGYYAFDERLLPIWAYAAQEGLPIMSHCIRGVIHYRGGKEAAWDAHPIFKRVNGSEQLELLQVKNVAFQENFTHPQNYLCLLAPSLLAAVLSKTKDLRLRALFLAEDGRLIRDLQELKICLAHFGGDDEWRRHLEGEADVMMQQLGLHPTVGLNFKQAVSNGPIDWDALESYWRRADWYSIICSLMLQYPGVYADISYILHDEAIRPLLKRTLSHSTLKQRVLFGTDFYVVRNHKSDTELLASIEAGLETNEFDLIARTNPTNYL